MKTIPLTQGFVALVDDEDFERVSAFKWFAKKGGRGYYAARKIKRADGVWTTQYLHQFICPVGDGQTDHKDGNGLNNQRHNLRPATHGQNQQGRQHKPRGTSSQYRGVHLHKSTGKWRARIGTTEKYYSLGLFNTEAAAARAYDEAARKHFGEFAAPNFP